MRNKIIIGNWKMNKTIKEAKEFLEEFKDFAVECKNHNVDVGIAAPYLCLSSIKKYSKSMLIAAENCHYEPSGAYTGEVSCAMLKDAGIKACIIGHSERRKYFNETNDECNKKIKALLSLKMLPIYCVGETLEEFEANESKKVVEKQLLEGLSTLKAGEVRKLVIAYEPVWSIGTGKSASKEIAEDMCKFIRSLIAKKFSKKAAEEIRIQYGGSVKAENAKEYLSEPDIDGCLVGGASLKVASFKDLVSKAF